ncbi:regulation of signal transduction [Nesidiocoris tenuis]|uniref:BOS complex subunit NCLN n=1 Tax=Nesidiocoris tenuis TaxID=355587 RepID=A0ABN7AGB9_9HEMI|nr:regulation of signal transduction [Nesidiocoris tenuis]
MFYEADEISEIFKGVLPVYLLFILPIILVISPCGAAHEFPVYRMHQFELHGVARGCKSAAVNLEVRSISSWRTQRHCVISRIGNLTSLSLHKLAENTGALLIVLPKNLATASSKEREVLSDIEVHGLTTEIDVPIYFALWTPDIEKILGDIDTGSSPEKGSSAWNAMIRSFSSNGYQIVVNTNKPYPRSDAVITSIQGKLPGLGVEEKLPTIVIVTHYDANGVAPDLSYGADSNGSGVIALLEIIRIFSHLYSSKRSHAPVNLVFLLASGGKYNFQGSKKWLEDQLDVTDATLLQDVHFVLCLDSIGQDNLYMHVSKPPKEGSSLHEFQKIITATRKSGVDIVHKKINLADEILAWEHERYSIRRLPSATLSSLKNHKDPMRGTILDVSESVNPATLARNIEDIATTLARYIYNVSGSSQALSSHMTVDEEVVKTWLDFLCSHPRAAPLLTDKNNPLVKSLIDTMSRFLVDVKTSALVADKRDPDFVFYDSSQAVCHIYNVKPALFDLFLTVQITAYLAVVHQIILRMPLIYDMMVPSVKKVKSQ